MSVTHAVGILTGSACSITKPEVVGGGHDGGKGADLQLYHVEMQFRSRSVEESLVQYTLSSTEPAAVALRMKIENLQHTDRALDAKRGGSLHF